MWATIASLRRPRYCFAAAKPMPASVPASHAPCNAPKAREEIRVAPVCLARGEKPPSRCSTYVNRKPRNASSSANGTMTAAPAILKAIQPTAIGQGWAKRLAAKASDCVATGGTMMIQIRKISAPMPAAITPGRTLCNCKARRKCTSSAPTMMTRNG